MIFHYHCFADVDECATANGGCEHNCHNTEGSFYCSCNDGYELLADNMSCIGIDTILLVPPPPENELHVSVHVLSSTPDFITIHKECYNLP